jgi:cation diffusion facilitator family transporter
MMNRQLTVPLVSVAIAIVVLGLKLAAWQVTGSVALFSDALESVVNVITAIVAFVAVRLGQRPADAALPYGYHKAEYFSAVFVGVMIIIAALLVGREAYLAFLEPSLPTAPELGLAISAGASVINLVWARTLLSHGRKVGSPALVADGKHLFTDVISTFAVIAGLGLVYVTGWAALDAVLAGFVAINILWSGWGVIRDSVGGLMDAALPGPAQQRIRQVIAASADGAIEAHDIRTRQAGPVTFIDFHLVVPGEMSVATAHDICDGIEAKLREAVERAQITIHVEPEKKAKHSGIVVV